MKFLTRCLGLAVLASSPGLMAAPPDFSLCNELPVRGGLKGMCYGYQASGCSYASTEQNCIQLELVFSEKAEQLGLEVVMPGSEPPADCSIAVDRSVPCSISKITYEVSVAGDSMLRSCKISGPSDSCQDNLFGVCVFLGSQTPAADRDLIASVVADTYDSGCPR